MARKAMATRETVEAAVEGLAAEGLDPTVERVRSKLGGGSYTTINKILGEVLSQRQTVAAQVSEVPTDLVEIGQKAVAAIYAAVQRQAAAKIDLIEADARKQIEAANRARAEAALEIERLELEAEQLGEGLAMAQRTTQEALARAERAEARADTERAEIERLARELATARAEAQSFQKTQAKLEAGNESLAASLGQVRQELMMAREAERVARDEAAEVRGQLKAASAGGKGK
jgi:chromosome segregation ATPase